MEVEECVKYFENMRGRRNEDKAANSQINGESKKEDANTQPLSFSNHNRRWRHPAAYKPRILLSWT